ncbi:hypothetical protein J4466_03555 [Candidatus Pacearchaeota archaeon]|nr:hypothetical protein [Candidatus Pacearchaeota archaeon]
MKNQILRVEHSGGIEAFRKNYLELLSTDFSARNYMLHSLIIKIKKSESDRLNDFLEEANKMRRLGYHVISFDGDIFQNNGEVLHTLILYHFGKNNGGKLN